jgi:hypothetical protein
MFITKFLLVLQCVLAFALLSWINALLIRVAILCSSTLIFPLLCCTQSLVRATMNNYQIAAIYRASPHIGAMAAYIDRRGTSKVNLIMSFFACLVTYYFMYGACYWMWTQLVFPNIMAKGINDLYFFYINLLEFISLFFFRTRSTLKYLPKYLTIVNLVFIFYVNSYMYAAQYEFFTFI